jgi:lysophospholipase L1-like esterase
LDLGARKEFASAMFFDQMHLNAEGHRAMADIIAGTIRAERWLLDGQ